MPLWLIGMMGAGKTAVAGALSTRLGLPALDTDAWVEERAGRTVAELWAEEGEDHFRELESSAVRDLASRAAVVATGGGVVLRPGNVLVMRESGDVVWLRAGVEALAQRCRRAKGRPLLDATRPTVEVLTALLGERGPHYRRAAHWEIDTEGLEVEEVAGRVLEWWKGS